MHTKKQLQALTKLPLASKNAFVAIAGQKTFVGLTIQETSKLCYLNVDVELFTIQEWAKRELKKLS